MANRFMQSGYCFLFCFTSYTINAQECDIAPNGVFLHGNNVRTYINNSGALFLKKDWIDEYQRYQVPYEGERSPSTISAQGLWLAGKDVAGNLRLSAQNYGTSDEANDYYPGPLDNDGNFVENCADWDIVWSVTRFDIERHLADFADNNEIEEPVYAIFAWPGRGNPHFLEYNGFELPNPDKEFAPFFDTNSDGIYNPLDGDYPIVLQSAILPQQMTWTIFNDLGTEQSDGIPLQFEIQLTSWAMNCSDNPQLNHAIFNSFKVINYSSQVMDSVYLGIRSEIGLGCSVDSYIGSAPAINTMFVYNKTNYNTDVSCPSDVPVYGENPPVQAVTVLNQNLSSFMYYFRPVIGSPYPFNYDPYDPEGHYHLLTGRWRTGAPLTYGGFGYDTSVSSVPTPFAFPGDPNDPEAWSQFAENMTPINGPTIGSVYLGAIEAGESETVDFGYSYYREEGNDHLENVSSMYAGVPVLQNLYDTSFENSCSPPDFCEIDCVWPGDANGDGIANHCDLLAIGVKLEQQGAERAGPYFWGPHEGADWATTQYNGTNDKHIDADGNGLIEPIDFEVTLHNYNHTRPDYAPEDSYDEGPELFLKHAFDEDFQELEVGESFLAFIGRQEMPELFGLAFSIEYDTAYFELIEFLGGDHYFPMEYTESYPDCGLLEYAGVKYEDQANFLEGSSILLRVRIRSDLQFLLLSDTSFIRFKNVKGVRADGTPIELGGTTIAATFQDSVISNNQELVLGSKLEVFPNPTTDVLTVQSKDLPIEAIQLVTISGKEVLSQAGLSENQLRLSIGHLPKGLYLLKLEVGEQVAFRKIVVE